MLKGSRFSTGHGDIRHSQTCVLLRKVGTWQRRTSCV